MSELDDERAAWSIQRPVSESALDFWGRFLDLRASDGHPLSEMARANWITIIRAISWVESRHGTIAGSAHGDVDPMQCANPSDSWWQELTGQTTDQDRFEGGPSVGNWNAAELPTAVKMVEGSIPIDRLGDVKSGHNDAAFTAPMSYFWAVPLVVIKSNKPIDGRAYKCGDSSVERLIGGAVRYNGGGDSRYEAKIRLAVAMLTSA